MPSRRLRWLASAARLLLWLVMSFWLLLGASWGLLHGWIVPRIGDFRPQLELQASRALGMPVRIGAVSAQSTGLIPSFELRDVVLLDQQGREALRLPRVLAALSPASLWGRGFEQLFIDQPTLEIRRLADGRIYVGGLDISQNRGDSSAAADWFFSQTEFSIRGGTIRWTDDLRAAPPLALTQVDTVIRNKRRRHLMRFDATPPPEWGERFSLRGIFRQPLLSTSAGRWSDWSGQLYADFEQVDLSHIRQYANLKALDIDVTGGRGALRAWADVKAGQITGATADVALHDVDTQLGRELKPLALDVVAGRFGGQKLANGFEFNTSGLRFATREGQRWPGGNLALLYTDADGESPQQLSLKADRLDLAALALVANRLPLGTTTHALVDSFAPRGLVETVDARLQGPPGAPVGFTAKGRVSGLALAALPSPVQVMGSVTHHLPGRPGVSGATMDFELSQAGGKASLSITNGALDLPGVFEDSRVPLDRLQMDAQWKQADGKTDVQMRNIRFSNADTEGQAQASWHSGDVVAASKTGKKTETRPHEASMGVLDLQGSLSRGAGTRVHRYLPLVLPEPVRHYVRDAVLKGDVSDVKFKVKGPVDHIPFADPGEGEFRISAKVKGGTFAYVPRSIQPKDAISWPALTDLNGELIFNRAALDINASSTRFAGFAGLLATGVEARIPDLMHSATVDINASLKGPVSELLGFVNTSPVGGMIDHVLDKTTVSGAGDYGLRLSLPIHTIEKSRVQGTISLPGNDVQISPQTPQLARLRGLATFSETGFAVTTAQARFLGGDIRFEGGTRLPQRTGPAATASNDRDETLAFKAQGSVTADGLRQLRELGFVSRLARNASGTTTYNASLAIRRGIPEVMVSSNLQGLALNLPAPLNKTAEAVLPLRFEQILVPESLAAGQRLHDQISLTLGGVGSAVYVRDISVAEPRVLRGSIGLGLGAGESAPHAENGVAANVNLASVDIDAWERVLSSAAAEGAGSLASSPSSSGGTAVANAYLPNVLAIRARELQIEGRRLNHVVVGGTRDGLIWRANIDADELSGYLEFAQTTGADRVYARLSRLSLGQSSASEVENLLDQQPANIPALDIVVDDLELRGRKLGRVEIQAVNRAAVREGGVREWRLNKFNVSLPEATLTATGNWVAINAQSPVQPAPAAQRTLVGPADRRRTVMNFRLDIADSGELLKRFGMKDVIRRGKGKMDGQVAWVGSPLSLDYPSMNGQFNINIESGQFLKADPGIAKLLGVLSLQSLPRRLTLDFRDVFSQGFAFDFVRGDVNINQGLAATNNLQMKGVNAAVLMDGSADIARETQDIKVVVVPEIDAGTASLIATAINPAIGLGTFLAQLFLRRPLAQAATQEFHITGGWADPKITKVEKKP